MNQESTRKNFLLKEFKDRLNWIHFICRVQKRELVHGVEMPACIQVFVSEENVRPDLCIL